ncbi:MAG: electron transporter RnfG [Bacteroidetes bacterium GWD2_45_23]|nr:MAG: electron transporter RnfG [Bacteroidetes bacterium GWC2_46_850]OFX65137.1 MAG: electron transporter RnfG [Bacteroidetes bacterium GWC1_47_7]OFX86213.1 MAG: electron transporter RnfG [Bacteroidetes bacterium GWD2_45_23]
MFLSLAIICLTVAVLLSQVNKMTAKPIAEARAMKLQNAIGEVVPAFDNDPVAEAYSMPVGTGDSLLVYPAKMGDKVVGYALNSSSNNGFSGEIQIMVGFDMEDRIINYAVLQHAETPGLGSKMTEWFKNQEKPSQSVIGRDLSQGTLTVSKDGGNVDAITASTITSRAFLEAINKAYLAYSGSKEDAHSGTTEKKITESSSDKSGRIKEEEKNNE